MYRRVVYKERHKPQQIHIKKLDSASSAAPRTATITVAQPRHNRLYYHRALSEGVGSVLKANVITDLSKEN
jgi:hypothetical protein